MYTIGQVSEMFDLPISTLRYYDKEGFFPHLVRKGNIRYFSNHEIEALHLIECLKKSGLGIKEINQFFSWVSEGSASFEKRKELFEARKEAVEAEIKSLQETLSLLEFCGILCKKPPNLPTQDNTIANTAVNSKTLGS